MTEPKNIILCPPLTPYHSIAPLPPTSFYTQMDPYDITEPKDILPLLKKEFWEGLESKKWSDRKEQLTALKTLATAHPHLASGRDVDYGDVGRELRKVIAKDANVACVAEAIACCGALAKGLRAGYSATAKVCKRRDWVAG